MCWVKSRVPLRVRRHGSVPVPPSTHQCFFVSQYSHSTDARGGAIPGEPGDGPDRAHSLGSRVELRMFVDVASCKCREGQIAPPHLINRTHEGRRDAIALQFLPRSLCAAADRLHSGQTHFTMTRVQSRRPLTRRQRGFPGFFSSLM